MLIRSFSIRLKQGLNFISNPYTKNIRLVDVKVRKGTGTSVSWTQAVTNGWVVNALFYFQGVDFGGGFGYDSVGGPADPVLAPWVGNLLFLNMNDATYDLVLGETGGGGTARVIRLSKTGQTIKYANGDDGDLQKGVAWPAPRFIDNNNGTVTDNLTGLIWLKNANCFGRKSWSDALTAANILASGACGLTDGSTAGQWRLPNRKELPSIVDRSKYNPSLPAGHPFIGVQSDYYWSSSTNCCSAGSALYVGMDGGYVSSFSKSSSLYVWPVRSGQ